MRGKGRWLGVRGKARWLGVLMLWTSVACATPPRAQEARRAPERPAFRPGITVLLDDSLHLIAGRRIGLITNHTGVDANGMSDVDLLLADPRVKRANVQLIRLFSPEHGIRGDKDVTDLPDQRDERSGLMVHSLYRRETAGPPDSLLRDLNALVFDLQDIGTRTWTFVGVMVYGMRAAARAGIPFVVLDRPNPLGGRAEGLLLDSVLANPEDPTPQRRGAAYALYPAPLRHGMTMGEMARWFAAELHIPVDLSVVRMSGYRRAMWWEDTAMPWVVPSPSMLTTASALIYPALVPFEGSNLSVGRGTELPFQQFGAPWLDAKQVADALDERGLGGVRFEAVRFTPVRPGDAKFAGREIPGVRIVIESRDRVQSARIGAAVLWTVAKFAPDSLRLNNDTFDRRMGASWARVALLRGDDPDEVIDRVQPEIVAFQRRVKPFLLY